MSNRNLPENVDSKFRFVLLAAQRAEQLMRGARPHVQAVKKPTRVAQDEVQKGLVQWEYGVEEVAEEPVETAAAEAPESVEEEVH